MIIALWERELLNQDSEAKICFFFDNVQLILDTEHHLLSQGCAHIIFPSI